jgi:hypothetical protein
MQRQMGDLALRVATIKGAPSGSSPPQPSLGPGFGGIPLLQNPVVSEVTTTQAPAATLPASYTATLGSTVPPPAPPSAPLPITQINFPHSPSQVPSLSSIMSGGHVDVMSPPRVHVPPETEAAGVPRYHKLSFPTYEGKEDPLGWLNRCERFFNAQRTREVDKVWLASFHLLGSAQQWYYVIERDAGTPSWEEFKQLCHQRFGPPLTTIWRNWRVCPSPRT